MLVAGCGNETGPEDTPRGPTPLKVDTEGLPDMPAFDDNPTTVEGVALGRRLFYDPILSGDDTQSCSSCHVQSAAFSDPRQFSIGIDGIAGEVNAPAIINLAWVRNSQALTTGLFWNGRAPSLEDQALQPVPNPAEMHLPWDDAEQKLNADPEYQDLFEKAFGTRTITRDLVVGALAQFERTLVSNNSRYDQWVRGEIELTQDEKDGREKFLSELVGDCFHCHGVGGLFTVNVFANNGLDLEPDEGRSEVTGNPFDFGKFRAPTLRNAEYTAPYMHDGRFETLREVLDHYSEGLVGDSPNLDTTLRQHYLNGRRLSDDDKNDIIAFIKSLSDPSFIDNPDFSDPFAQEAGN
jgi:cytochrome c peroxidase